MIEMNFMWQIIWWINTFSMMLRGCGHHLSIVQPRTFVSDHSYNQVEILPSRVWPYLQVVLQEWPGGVWDVLQANCDSSLIPRRGNEPGNETNMTVSYRSYSVTYLNCIEELNQRAYISGPGSRSGYSGHGLTNIYSDFIATPTAHLWKCTIWCII